MKHNNLDLIKKVIVGSSLSLVLFSTSSCFKKVDSSQVTVPTGATTLSPTSGTSQTVISINGNGFPDKSQIQVTVNGKVADVITASSNQIQARVPKAAGTGDVIVSFNGTNNNIGTFTYYFTHFILTNLTDGSAGYADGPLNMAMFDNVAGLAMDKNDKLYVTGASPFAASPARIRSVNFKAADTLVSTVAGSGTSGDLDGQGTSAFIGAVRQMSVGPDGSLYLLDRTFKKVKKVDALGNVTTLFTLTYTPEGIRVGKSGSIYVTGPGNYTGLIQKYNAAGVLQWTVRSHGTSTGPGVDGDSSVVKFQPKNGIEVSPDETKLYFAHFLSTANSYGSQVKILDLQSLAISTLAGDPANTGGANSADGDYASAGLNWIGSMVADENGGLYIADYFGFVKYINNGLVRTIVNSAGADPDQAGDETQAQMIGAWGIVRDSKGNIIVTDFDANKINYVKWIY
jgi:serine/threonine protein kinase, bacterial